MYIISVQIKETSHCPYFYLLLRGKPRWDIDKRKQSSVVVIFNREWQILSFFLDAFAKLRKANISFVISGLVSPCGIIYSNESNNQMRQFLRFIVCRLNPAQNVSGIPMPKIRSLSTAPSASGLPSELGDSSAVGRGRSDHDQQHCYHHVSTVNQRLMLQLISSWWWARRFPKHVKLYLNDKQ